ncbi:MAG: plastocyanin/azurin family copper-binding protein [Deltaproteobacteria bacterium]|nr:plastocyanin/azurin family copper-binding protein [Deltaproteobacteria bacterium]MCL5278075.1 plastocyanin/azurin family copper-binding protein [Deltaproteobacteria bacterium]
MKKGLILYGALACLLAVAGCGGSSGGKISNNNATGCTVTTATATTSVTASDSNYTFAFTPSCIKISSGQTVTWTNAGSMNHTVTSDSGAPVTFDSGSLSPGQTFSHTFSSPGTIGYHCTYHVSYGMKGTVIVQ